MTAKGGIPVKRLIFAVCLLLTLALAVPVCAESTIIAADEDDLVIMLEEALEQMEFDYSSVTLNREDKIIVMNIATDGLTADLLALKELGFDETYEPWAEMREAMVYLHKSVLDMFSTVHREDMKFILNVVNDDAYIREDYSTIYYNPLLTVSLYSMVFNDVMEEDY
jgi:hypothetical protein